jgi:hypothetical protein
MPFNWNTWIISPLAGILIPCFWRKVSKLLFAADPSASARTKSSLEAGRYVVMLFSGIANLLAAQYVPMNRTFSLAVGLGGGLCILDANAEYWWYMNDGLRVLTLGATLIGLLGVAYYFG